MVDAVDASSTITSGNTDVSQVDKFSIHCKFSANVSGSFTVEAKNSDNDSYYVLDFGSALTLTTASECQIVCNEVPFKLVRLVWTPSAATATLTATLAMKSVGA